MMCGDGEKETTAEREFKELLRQQREERTKTFNVLIISVFLILVFGVGMYFLLDYVEKEKKSKEGKPCICVCNCKKDER